MSFLRHPPILMVWVVMAVIVFLLLILLIAMVGMRRAMDKLGADLGAVDRDLGLAEKTIDGNVKSIVSLTRRISDLSIQRSTTPQAIVRPPVPHRSIAPPTQGRHSPHTNPY